MSRTKKTGGSNSPVKKYLSFKGSKGQLAYYDKNSSEEDKNVYLDSVKFAVLDIKSSVSGFNEATSSTISSNYLDPYDVGKEEFIVKTKVNNSFGVFAKGIWKDIKKDVDTINGKFTSNVFALADLGDGLEIVKLELSGASLRPWIEFQNTLGKSASLDDQYITISQGQLCTRKKGETVPVTDDEYNKVLAALKKNPLAERPVWFYEPKFVTEPLPKEVADLADDSDEILQSYFDESGGKDAAPEDSPKESPEQPKAPIPPVDSEKGEKDDLPF